MAMTNLKLRSFNYQKISRKMKLLAGLVFIMIVSCGCSVTMQPVQSPRYFNYVEPRPNYYWYYPYYTAPTFHIYPRPRTNHNNHHHNHQHHGPRR